MLKIALIDDQSYGILQIHELHEGDDYEFTYFETFKEFKGDSRIWDIVYLDYYLDKDGLKGGDIVSEVREQANKIIGFSSVKSKNEEIIQAGAEEGIQKKIY